MKKQIQNQLGEIFKKNLSLFKRPAGSKKAGTAPGTLIYTGEKTEQTAEIGLIKYDAGSYEIKTSENVSEILDLVSDDKINWINIDALHNVEIIKLIGEKFDLHPLILEDILNLQQMPKTDIEDDYSFITLKMLRVNKTTHEIEHEQISFVLGKYFLISFQERKSDIFNIIKERLINSKGRIRKRSADYLLYLLIDAVVDNYYLVVDNISDKIDRLEEQLYYNPSTNYFENIIHSKKELIYLKKAIFPLESALSNLSSEDNEIVDKDHYKYYSDINDHIKIIIQDVEVMREVLIGHVELYMSSMSNKMNNIMKTLTIVASIFIPLTFVAGVYGMNFRYMPELQSKWGYPVVLISMALISIVMLIFMKRKKWF